MVKTYGLTHLALAVRDVERSFRFYQQVFGAVEIYRGEGFIIAYDDFPNSADTLSATSRHHSLLISHYAEQRDDRESQWPRGCHHLPGPWLERPGPPNQRGDLTISSPLAIRNVKKLLPNRSLKGRASNVKRHRKVLPQSFEILPHLQFELIQKRIHSPDHF